MPTSRLKADDNSGWSVGIRRGSRIRLLLNNIYVNNFPRKLGSMKSILIKPVTISYFSHQISTSLAILNLLKMNEWKNAVDPNKLMRANDLRNNFRLSFIQQHPRLCYGIYSWRASNKKRQIFSCGVTTIDHGSEEADIFSNAVFCVNRYGQLRLIKVDKCSLTYDIILSRKISLPATHTSG